MKYEDLVSQLEKVRIGKKVEDLIDYGTDALTDDWVKNKFDDWERKISDLLDRIQSVKAELENSICCKSTLLSNSEKSNLKNQSADHLPQFEYKSFSEDLFFDPFGNSNDQFSDFLESGKVFFLKWEDEKTTKIEVEQGLKSFQKQLDSFPYLKWLDEQMENTRKCSDFYDSNKDKEPFVLGKNLDTIPFFGNQDSFMTFMYLMTEGDFFLAGKHTDREILKQHYLDRNRRNEFENFATITKKEFSQLCARYFHSIELVPEKNNLDQIQKKFFNPKALIRNMNKSTGKELDTKTLNELISRFSQIIKNLEGFKNEKEHNNKKFK